MAKQVTAFSYKNQLLLNVFSILPRCFSYIPISWPEMPFIDIHAAVRFAIKLNADIVEERRKYNPFRGSITVALSFLTFLSRPCPLEHPFKPKRWKSSFSCNMATYSLWNKNISACLQFCPSYLVSFAELESSPPTLTLFTALYLKQLACKSWFFCKLSLQTLPASCRL